MASNPEADSAPRRGAEASNSAKAAEKQRLAEALRDNLRRRKAQDRGRRAAAAETPGKVPPQ